MFLWLMCLSLTLSAFGIVAFGRVPRELGGFCAGKRLPDPEPECSVEPVPSLARPLRGPGAPACLLSLCVLTGSMRKAMTL